MPFQWRIRDFKEGAPALGGTNILFDQFFPKTAENEEILDLGGGGGMGYASLVPLDPPLPFLRAFKHSVFHFCNITLQN